MISLIYKSLKLKEKIMGTNLNKVIQIFSLIIFFSFYSFGCTDNGTIHKEDLKVLHEKTFNISPGKSLNLQTDAGDVIITAWDKPQVYVKISGNSKAEEKMDFTFNNDQDLVEIIGKKESSLFNWFKGISVKYEIKVPSKFNNKVSTAGGDLSLVGIKGKNILKTSGGDIEIKNHNGELNVSTSGGDIHLDDASGTMDLSTSGGDITCSNFKGSLNLATSGGDISLNGSDTKIDASTSGGNIVLDYTGENKGIELETSGGDINIKLPGNFNASAKMYTSGGNVSCEFKGNNAVKISSTKFEADINNGGMPLIAKTSGGDIRVNKQ